MHMSTQSLLRVSSCTHCERERDLSRVTGAVKVLLDGIRKKIDVTECVEPSEARKSTELGAPSVYKPGGSNRG